MKHQATPCPICSRPAEEPKFRPFCSAECSNTDLDRVCAELVADLEKVAEELLGPRNAAASTQNTWRWGTKGSLKLEVRGRKRGVWQSKEGGEGGGIIALIAFANKCSIAQAIRWARAKTGGPAAGFDHQADNAVRRAERDRKAREGAAEEAKEVAGRIGYARRLWGQSVPVAGTVAEVYLTRTRNVPAPESGGWPDSVRFHPASSALIVAATLAAGSVQAVQRVFLAATGAKIDAAEMAARKLPAVKVTNGAMADAAVRLQAVVSSDNVTLDEGPLLLTEGPETGLSVWASTGRETWIALGGMAGVPLPLDRRIVVCRDDDPKHSPADRKMAKAIGRWRAAGHQAAVATPWPLRAYNRSDFNDALKSDGVTGVRRRIEAALNPGGGPAARLPIKQVREKLRTAVAGFYDATRAWNARHAAQPPEHVLDPDARPVAPENWDDFFDQPVAESTPPAPVPVHAIKVDVGSGKTLAALQESIRLLAEMRAADDARSGGTLLDHVRQFGMETMVGSGTGAAVGGGVGGALFGVPGSIVGGTIGGVAGTLANKVASSLKAANIATVDGLVKEAMLNPGLARVLLSKVTPETEQNVGRALVSTLRRSAVAGATVGAGRQDQPTVHSRQPIAPIYPKTPLNALAGAGVPRNVLAGVGAW